MQRAKLAFTVLALTACNVQMRAQASSGSGASGASAPEPKKPEKHRDKADGKSHSVGFSTSFHESGSVKIDWQGRSGNLCRAAAPYKFVGMAKASGSAKVGPSGASATGKAEASGKSSGGDGGDCSAPRTPVPRTPEPAPIKPEPTKPVTEKPTKVPPKSGTDKSPPATQPKHGEDKKAPDKPKEQPPTPTGPTPGELETPIDPPSTPADNPFGYPTPVRGCFEGQVFPLKPETAKLPTSYDALTPVSVVYACEWDIAPRAWEQGFPGVADRFEWFAIRYGGAFRLAKGGEYGFRISSDDGAKLTIDGKLVIDNDGQHPPKEARGTVKLDSGDHQMVLEYFQGPRYHINLQLWVTPPGKPEELFTVR